MNNLLQYLLGAFSQIVNKIAITANAFGTLVVLALVIVVNYDVVARSLFNLPFRGAVEVVQFSMVLIVFLQLPDVIRVNRLTRSEGFLLLIEPRAPRFAFLLSRGIEILSSVFMALIALAIWPEFVEMWDTKHFFGIPGIFTAPWWPIKLAIFVSAIICTIILMLNVINPSIENKGTSTDRNGGSK